MESRGIAGGQTSREVGPRGASGGGNIDRARFGGGGEGGGRVPPRSIYFLVS